MSMNFGSDSVVVIPRSGLPVALAMLEEYLAKTGDFQQRYLRERLAALPGGGRPLDTIAFLLGGSMDLPVNFAEVTIDPSLDAVVLKGFGVSYEDDDSDNPVADIIDFFARLAPAVVPGTVVTFTADPYEGPEDLIDYRLDLNRPGAPITVATRRHWTRNEEPWSPLA